MTKLTINPDYLPEREAHTARYLAALATYNEARAKALAKASADMKRDGSFELPPHLDDLHRAVLALAPDWRESALPISEVARRTDTPVSTLRAWAASGYMNIRAEQRGKLWYMCLEDVESAIRMDAEDDES